MIPTTKSEITSNLDELESQEFTMLVGEKAFSILVDSLYTDKVLAAVRELCTNAVDAHVMAGRADQPFKVTLPTYLENTFSVRDWGCSMDHDTIMNLYSKLFWSPKDTTNTQVGYLGLGSKAPLAYTDSFSVIAYLDGIRRDYLVGLNQERIPTITKVNESDTLEPDGLEVSFPVQMGDSDLFQKAAKKVFVGLDVKPECNIEIQLPEVELEFDNWKIYSSALTTYGHKFFIKQGCVLYPVDLNQRVMKHYSDNMMVIDVPIGSVEVATSREALSLDERTQNFIKQLSEELSLSLERCLNEQLALQKNTIDAAIFLYDKIQPIFDESYTKGLGLTYNGKKIDRFIRFLLSVPTEYLSNGKDWVTKKEITMDVTYLSTIKFIIQKEGQKVQRRKARLKAYIKDQPRNTSVYFVNGPTNKDISRLLRFYILPENIIPIERIPDTETTTSGNKSVSKTGAYMYNDDGHHELVENIESDFLWLPINRKNGEFTLFGRKYKMAPSSKWGSYTYNDLNSTLHLLKITDKPIYHLTPMMQKKFGVDSSNSLDTIINNWMNRNLHNVKIAYFVHEFAGGRGGRTTTGILRKEIENANYIDWISDKPIATVSKAATKFILIDLMNQWDEELESKKESIRTKYPMLHNPSTEEEMEYIKMVDSQQNG